MMWSCKANQFLLLIILMISSSESHSVLENTNRANPEKIFQDYPIKRGLYTGDSIKEFLKICITSPKVQLSKLAQLKGKKEGAEKKEYELNATYALKDSGCTSPEYNASFNFTMGELFRLQYGQKKIREQQEYILDLPRGMFSVFLFLLVLAMLIFLAVVGHFKWSTLPLIGYRFQKDPTEGVKFDQYVWMKFLVLEKKSWVFRGRDMSKYDWFTYHKWDHHFNLKDIGAATRFKFLDRKFVNHLPANEEVKARKKQGNKKQGWDFLVPDRVTDFNADDRGWNDEEVVPTGTTANTRQNDQTKNIYNT